MPTPHLIDSLLERLDADEKEGEFDTHPQEQWHEEIRCRVTQIDTGDVSTIPWADARSALRGKLHR
jgi:hypothetical protein